ncbi:DUF86 domain-containing protein [Beijerinckia sp. L45]|uniref:HepT-like ribonuclease domain-containing protein n=1 Tax=Beijerinckia sp. L45 TaxID=1641855 RepID=UPI001FEF0B85|nr:HepT-like ribonuclease domain-containing protein [Beijerinckia sp. L45]
MLAAIALLDDALGQKTFDDYDASTLLRLGCERAVEIISEASRHIPEDIKARYPDVEWRSIAGIGNVLRHEYAGVQSEIIWGVIQNHLPALRLVLYAIDHDLPPP